jgi:crossover junction endodeoxyribonuclease RusA
MIQRELALHLELPYPDPALSPNSPKRHWRSKQPAKETAREESFLYARPYVGMFTNADLLQMSLTFHPPNKKRRDLDNAYASMKSTLDGMCQGLEIDDAQIHRVTLVWGEENGGSKRPVVERHVQTEVRATVSYQRLNE